MRRYGIILIFIVGLLISGCVPLIIGGVGILGGYAISRDTVAIEMSRDEEDIWRAAKEVVSKLGIIETADDDIKVLEANIYSSSVVIRVERLTDATNRLRVKARKFLLPNVGLAQKVFVKIIQKLE